MNTFKGEVESNFDRLPNFRDMGGLKTLDGRSMKRGVLYRSGDLSKLTGYDLKRLQRYRLKLICDLRTPGEHRSKPGRVNVDENVRLINVPIYDQHRDFHMLNFIKFLFGKPKDPVYDKLIREYYHKIAFECTSQVREVISLVAQEKNLPALIHCAAGKDRTGYISALIQLLAGVPYEKVLDDYLATNRYYEPQIKKITGYLKWMTLFRVSPDRVRRVFQARREYLDTVYEKIQKKYGSIEGYLCDACGINNNHIQDLQKLLVE